MCWPWRLIYTPTLPISDMFLTTRKFSTMCLMQRLACLFTPSLVVTPLFKVDSPSRLSSIVARILYISLDLNCLKITCILLSLHAMLIFIAYFSAQVLLLLHRTESLRPYSCWSPNPYAPPRITNSAQCSVWFSLSSVYGAGILSPRLLS